MKRLNVEAMLAPLNVAPVRRDAAPPTMALHVPATHERPGRTVGGFWSEAQRVVTELAERNGVRADAVGGGWQNLEMGLGGITNRVSRSTFMPSMQLPEQIVDALLQFNGVGRRLCEREPQDATREGFSLGADPLAVRLQEHAIEWGVLRNLRLGRMYARAYGGAGIVMLIDDGQEAEKPLDRTRIRKVNGARVLHRYELVPVSYERDPKSPRVGKPTVYSATFGGVATQRVHHTRVIVMQGFDLPERVMVRQQGWGGSVFDLAWRSLRNWQVTLELLPEMASRWTQGVYTQRHLPEGVGAGLASEIVGRMEAMRAGMSVLGDLTLSPEEKYEILSSPSSGMSEIVEALETALVADGDQPRLILFGETSGGLHAGKDNPEMRAWLDSVAAKQPEDYTPPLAAQLEVLALAQEGPTGGEVPRLKVEWLPLYQQTAAERDAARKARAECRSIDLNASAISTVEARTDPDLAELYALTPATSAATPGVEPDGSTAGAGAETVAELAMNGAQVSALVEVVSQVTAGTLTYEQGIGVLGVAFPTIRGREVAVLGPKPITPPAMTGTVQDQDPLSGPSDDPIPDDVVSPKDAAAKYRVSTRTITRLIETAAIRYWGLGGHIRVSLSDVARAARAHEDQRVAEDGALKAR